MNRHIPIGIKVLFKWVSRSAKSLKLTVKLALWSDHALLRDFEDKIYATGFKPNGKGF